MTQKKERELCLLDCWQDADSKKRPFWRRVQCSVCRKEFRQWSTNKEQWFFVEEECSCLEVAEKLLPPTPEREGRLILDVARGGDISPPAKEAVRRLQKIFRERERRRNAKK